MANIEERVKYYLGELYNKEKVSINDKSSLTVDTLIPEKLNDPKIIADYFGKYNYEKLYKIGGLYNVNDIVSHSIYEIIEKKLIPDMFYKVYFNDYANLLKQKLIKYNHTDKKFLCDFCDIFYVINNYKLVKNRYSKEEKKTVILRSLNFKRHWYNYYNRPADIPFEEKIDKVYWRGTTTGNEKNFPNRFDLVKKYYDEHTDIDVGFSFVCQGNEKYMRYVKGKDDIGALLNHKYILSLEGNDKDSGLNWKLNSNSLIFMPAPRCFSWLMEDKLIPDYHYILIKDNYSDLHEKLKWCKNNQGKCKEIIRNAHDYMRQFFDESKEELLEKKVLDVYFEKISGIF